MNANFLKIEPEGRLLRLRLARPARRNALTADLCQELLTAIEKAEADSSLGAMLLEAEGPVFCAGMDLDEALDRAAELHSLHERLFSLGFSITKPLIAAVQGPALGGGVGLVANAHVALAAQGATFGLTEIRVGMWPFLIFRSVAAAIGERRTIELALSGRIFSAQDALHWGLVHELAPPIELEDRALAVAHNIASSSSQAIRLGLACLTEARRHPPERWSEIARRYRHLAFQSADFHEGVTAFREKRKPVWRYD